jgi:hypothetical protein
MELQTNNRLTIRYIFTTLIAVVFTWLLHEFTHWVTGEALGNDMSMTLNAAFPKNGVYTSANDETLTSIAGPLITLLQALVVYVLLKKKASSYLWFPFLFTCFYMRLIAGFMNFIMLNDEGRVSQDIGIGTFTLSVIFSLILLYLVYDIVKKRHFSTKLVVATLLLVMLFSSILILGDQMIQLKLL